MPKCRRVKRHFVTQPTDPSYRLIPLTQGQNAKVDTADFEWLSQYNWSALWSPITESFYARRWYNIHMHRLILGYKESEEADHINHDTLDNRRSNLRKCTKTQNRQNRKIRHDSSSGYKGVWFCPEEKKWRAHIHANGKRRIIGRFSSAEKAAKAYDAEAKLVYGKFAHTNF